jgi:glucose/arabinose dehydrogenase
VRRLVVAGVAVLLSMSACSTEPADTSVPVVPTAVSSSTSTEGGPAGTGIPDVTTAPPESTTAAPEPATTIAVDATRLRLVPVADGFEQPVFFTESRGRSFVVDQPGVIWEVTASGDVSTFLDIRDRVGFGGEQGLLGLAFHPEYGGVVYVDYTARDGRTVVSEFTIPDGSSVPDPATERVVVEVPQPAANHNGGMIAFGPHGDLWIGMGDGGGANDRYGNGQRGDTLLGAMLRLSVEPGSSAQGSERNGAFASPEIAAIGLRNPWRFSFDGETLWIADVGQGDIEEVNRVSADTPGLNFGWPLYEGSACFAGPCDGVDAANRPLTWPVHEYGHDEGCSVTGGYVYRGSALPQLDGHYFFSDWCGGFIRSIAPDGAVVDWTEQTGPVASVTSFGRDERGEIYVVSGQGTVYRVVAADG